MKKQSVMLASVVVMAFVQSLSVCAQDVFRMGDIMGTLGKTNGRTEGAFVLGGSNQFDPLHADKLGSLDVRSYGGSQLRAEFGTGASFATDHDRSGISFIFADKKTHPLFINMGIEPLNIDFSVSTNKDRLDYFEWTPMGSAGLELATDTCDILAQIRGGASIGTLGGANGGRAAYGASTQLTCNQFRVAAGIIRINGKDRDVDLADITVKVPMRKNVSLFVKGEAIVDRKSKDGSLLWDATDAADRADKRILAGISIRTK